MLCHVSVQSGAFCLTHRARARDPISVAFFDRVALFSNFNHLFELLDQVLLPIFSLCTDVPLPQKKSGKDVHKLYIKLKKLVKTLKRSMFPIQSLRGMRSLSESRGGSKVTKPIYNEPLFSGHLY